MNHFRPALNHSRPLSPRPRWKKPRWKKLGAATLALTIAASLAGCNNAKVDQHPAEGSPDLMDVRPILASMPLMGVPLQAFNKDESFQLRQQFELEAGEAKKATVTSDSAQCDGAFQDSFDLPNLYWPSIVATSSDSKSSAQVFLAPNSETVQQALDTIAKGVKACPDATINLGDSHVKITVRPRESKTCRPAYTQTVTHNGETQALEVCYAAKRNALLALATSDQYGQNTGSSLDEYATTFFARLEPLYR